MIGIILMLSDQVKIPTLLGRYHGHLSRMRKEKKALFSQPQGQQLILLPIVSQEKGLYYH